MDNMNSGEKNTKDPQQLSVGTKKWTKALTDSEEDLKWESKEQQRCNMFTRAFGPRKDCEAAKTPIENLVFLT